MLEKYNKIINKHTIAFLEKEIKFYEKYKPTWFNKY